MWQVALAAVMFLIFLATESEYGIYNNSFATLRVGARTLDYFT